ncbi:MAG: hypothetical protein LBE56_12215 [Tannerella sp.]|jgi:hypothetical protein|nr:hypothetical protein [Tannerella sp.]
MTNNRPENRTWQILERETEETLENLMYQHIKECQEINSTDNESNINGFMLKYRIVEHQRPQISGEYYEKIGDLPP